MFFCALNLSQPFVFIFRLPQGHQRFFANPASWSSFTEGSGTQFMNQISSYYQRQVSKSSSLDDSLSKSSLSQTSQSSSDKDSKGKKYNFDIFNDIQHNLIQTGGSGRHFNGRGKAFTRQTSQISNASSLMSWTGSEIPNTSTSNSRCTSTGDSMFDDTDLSSVSGKYGQFREYQHINKTGPTRRRSSSIGSAYGQPYSPKKPEEGMKTTNKEKKHRDLIVQDDEEDFPFSTYTFNKKKEDQKDSSSERKSSVSSSLSQRSSSQDSIYSVGLMNQYMKLNKTKMVKKPSTSSLTSSMTDMNQSTSIDDANSIMTSDNDFRGRRVSQTMPNNPSPNSFAGTSQDMAYYPAPQYQQFRGYGYPQPPMPAPPLPNMSMTNKIGFDDAMTMLPERFYKSWFEKTLISQQEEYLRQLIMSQTMSQTYHNHSMSQGSQYNQFYVDDIDLPPSVSAQHSQANTPQFGRSLENIHASIFPQGYQSGNWHRNSQSRTISSSQGSTDLPCFERNPSQSNSVTHSLDREHQDHQLSNVGALPLKKENSFDKLKRILQTTDTSQYRDRSSKRFMFASNHQKSLPIFLETLSEEEEERKRSRTPSFDKEQLNIKPKTSKLRTFFEEEQLCSNAGSDYQSDSSLPSSTTMDQHGVTVEKNKRHSFQFIESDDSYSTCSSSSKNEANTNALRQKSLSIPSIVVSQKIENGQLQFVEGLINDIKMTSTEKRRSERLSNSRPTSPNPENQTGEEGNVHSKDSLEIDEILSPKDKEGSRGFVATLKKIDSVSSTGIADRENLSAELTNHNSAPQSTAYLSISDADDKLLSPSSSVASPYMMSPVTVIEMSDLDNQGDCLDIEESKDSEHNNCGTNSNGDKGQDDKSNNEMPEEFNRGRRPSKKFKAPKCLKLKRHIDEVSHSGSEKVGNNASVEKKELTDVCVQADDDSLVPLIKLSEIATLLKHVLRKMPQLTESNVFVLVQDRATQCVFSGPSENQGLPDDNSEGKGDKENWKKLDMGCQTSFQSDEGGNMKQLSLYERLMSGIQNKHFEKPPPDNHVNKICIPISLQQDDTCIGKRPIDKAVYKSEVQISLKPIAKEPPIICEKESESCRTCDSSIHEEHLEATQNTECESVSMQNIVNELKCCSIKLPKEYSCESDQHPSLQEVKVEVNGSTRASIESTNEQSTYQDKTSMQKDVRKLSACRIQYEHVDAVDIDKLVKSELNERNHLDGANKETISCPTKNVINAPNDKIYNAFYNNQPDEDQCVKKMSEINDNPDNGVKLDSECQSKSGEDFSRFHSAFYINLEYGQTYEKPCPKSYLEEESFFIEHKSLEGICNSNAINEQEDVCPHYFKSWNENGCVEACDILMTCASMSEKSKLFDKLPVPKADSGFNESKSWSDGDRSANDLKSDFGEHIGVNSSSDISEHNIGDGELFDNDDTTHQIQAKIKSIIENSVNIINNDNSSDVKYITNVSRNGSVQKDLTRADTDMDIIELEELHNDTRDIESGHETKRNGFAKQLTEGPDEVFEEGAMSVLVNTDIRYNETQRRSIDFETEFSRRNILQRTQRTGAFSNTLDVRELDIGFVEVGTDKLLDEFVESIILESEDTDFEDVHKPIVNRDCNLCFTDKQKHSPHKFCSDNSVFRTYKQMKTCDNKVKFDDLLDMPVDIEPLSEQTLLQLGLNYDEVMDMYNTYGRVKYAKVDFDDISSLDNNLDCDSVADTIDGFLDELQTLSMLDMNSESYDVFDMFQQINEEDDSGNSGKDELYIDSKTQETLDKIEKMYNLTSSFNGTDEEVCDLEIGDMKIGKELDRKAHEKNSESSKIDLEALMDDVDLEIQKLDSYTDRFQFTETHTCRNCTHSVTIPSVNNVKASVFHDYCQECSPLNLTAEMLEKRRLAKITPKHYSVG